MKALFVRISISIIGLSALLYFLSCSQPPQSNNAGQNKALPSNQNQGNGSPSVRKLDECKDRGNDAAAFAQVLKNELVEKIKGSELKALFKDADNPNGTFTVDVQHAPNTRYYVGLVLGQVGGDDNLKVLSDILNDFQDEDECMRVVRFYADVNADPNLSAPGFEWGSCPYPTRVCDLGECCPRGGDTNSNTNGNTKTPTPAPANGNGNANRSGSTNTNK